MFCEKKNMQREEEIYKRILNAVLSVTELTEQQLLFSRTEECVDARCVLIELLTKCGFSDSRCAKHTQRTRSAVCMMRNRFRERSQRKFVALTLSDVKDFLERNKFESNQ